jgi:uncharacterized protein YbjT (DUF2867 family)
MGTPFEDGTEGEIRRGKLMADIAKENSIEHLVYISIVNADKNTRIPRFESKYKVEQHLKTLEFLILLLVPPFLWKTCLVQD